MPKTKPNAPQNLNTSAPATTTKEQDRRTNGQRRINFIWEWTQAILAISVIEVTLLVIAVRVLNSNSVMDVALLTGLANLVIGFYFGRTNHARIGGDVVGKSATPCDDGSLDDR